MSPRVAALAVVLCLASCQPPPLPPPPPKADGLVVDRKLVRTFRDYCYASYDRRLAQNDPPGPGKVSRLEERVERTREVFRDALRRAGADEQRVARDDELFPIFREGIQRGGRFAFLFSSDEDSFTLVRIQERGLARQVVLFGESFSYELTVFDETLVLDYPSYGAIEGGIAVPRQTATYRSDGTVSVDLSAAHQVGESLFLPRVDALREAARKAASKDSFLALASKEQLPELLRLAKEGLRWRSLEQLWSLIQTRSRDEQLRRFSEDYAARKELQAVAELRELEFKLDAAKPARSAMGPAERQSLAELGTLSVIIHGEPLGAVADVLALTIASFEGHKGPPFRAARKLVLDMVGLILEENELKPSPKNDALAFARLARATPEELRAIAAAIYAKRTK